MLEGFHPVSDLVTMCRIGSGAFSFPERRDLLPFLPPVAKCVATLLVNMRDIEPRKEDDGFDGAFLSP